MPRSRFGSASWHDEFREWAKAELGDSRQVYARRAGAPRDADLVFMPDGEALQFRDKAKSGALICPVPGCSSYRLTTCSYKEKRDHFRHVDERRGDEAPMAPGSKEHREAYRRVATLNLLRDWAAGQDQVVEVGRPRFDGSLFEMKDVSFILLARLDDGSEVALCYVDRRLGCDTWEEHHDFLLSAGLAVAWIFALRETYFKLPDPADPIDVDRRDLIVEKPIYRRMRKRGSWPLLINLGKEKFANVVMAGGGRAHNLGFAPTGLDKVVHYAPARLAECRLCPYGIETPAISEWILRESSGGN